MKTALSTFLMLATAATLCAQTKPVYENNFEKAEVDKVPEGFLVLDGGFAVKEENGNKSLELPGAPLDSFGALFGPTEASNLSVSARIFGTGKGRRFPTMAVGLNGGGGYKLQVSPGKKLIELYKGDEVKATAPFDWATGTWTMFRLQVRKVKDGEWKIEGRAWAQTAKEPADWPITFTDTQEPPPGRPSIWGNPFSTTPILFDDLVVTPVK
jgi:hypothetical protein